jgi:hypothetical protein
MTNGNTNKTETNPIALTNGELDLIRGGEINGYHECTLGSAAGGAPGLYPNYVACRLK